MLKLCTMAFLPCLVGFLSLAPTKGAIGIKLNVFLWFSFGGSGFLTQCINIMLCVNGFRPIYLTVHLRL